MKKSIIWKILVYFIIYSIIGFIMETSYAIIMEGIIESRKSFIYGPFCIVYGIGAIILIFSLKRFRENKFKLFIYGMILGSVIEYFSSLIGELIFHVKWWDYSNSFFNINGRTCLYFAIIWGVLSVILINYINPKLDSFLYFISNRFSVKILKVFVYSITIFMILDGVISSFALQNFVLRISENYNIDIKGLSSKKVANLYFENTFSDSKMIMTYPNIIVVSANGENLYLENVLSSLKNYYYKFDR